MSEKRVFRVNFTSTVMQEMIVPRMDIPPDSQIVRVYQDPKFHSLHPDTLCVVFSTDLQDDPRYPRLHEGSEIPIVVPSFYETVDVKKWS